MKGRNGKIHRQPVTTATKFSNCLIDWLGGGSTLALFAAEFSLELYYLPDKSLSEPSRICSNRAVNGVPNSFVSRHSWTKAFPDGNGCKSVVDLPNGHFSSNYKTGKKNMLSFPSGFENFEDSWWQLITSLLGICPQTSWNTPKTLDFASPSGTCSLGIFQCLSRTCKMKDERTHTKMMSTNSNRFHSSHF